MSFDLIIRSKAKYDLEDIELYYDNISNKLTDQFFSEFYETIEYIKLYPELYPIKYNGIRIALLYRFPYGIHYIVRADTIVIRRILHTSRYFQ